MTAPAALDAAIEDLDFQLACNWGQVVQPYLSECAEKPVWIVECPGCANSWAMSCHPHYEMTLQAACCYECLDCGKEWDPTDLKWGKL